MDETVTYKSIEKKIAQAEKDAKAEVSRLETKKRLFINEQTFTGHELMIMKNAMKSNKGGCDSEPCLYYVLEQILKNREKNE